MSRLLRFLGIGGSVGPMENLKAMAGVPLYVRTVIYRIMQGVDWARPQVHEITTEDGTTVAHLTTAGGFSLGVSADLLRVTADGVQPVAQQELATHIALTTDVFCLAPQHDRLTRMLMDDQIPTLERRADESDDLTKGLLVSQSGELEIDDEDVGRVYVISRSWEVPYADVAARTSVVAFVVSLDAGVMQGCIQRALTNHGGAVH